VPSNHLNVVYIAVYELRVFRYLRVAIIYIAVYESASLPPCGHMASLCCHSYVPVHMLCSLYDVVFLVLDALLIDVVFK
jgi:hypothetical protein